MIPRSSLVPADAPKADRLKAVAKLAGVRSDKLADYLRPTIPLCSIYGTATDADTATAVTAAAVRVDRVPAGIRQIYVVQTSALYAPHR